MGIKPVLSTLTVTTAGTATQCAANSLTCISVYFEALDTNAGAIYIGDSTVSTTKYITKLAAGSGFGISTDAQGHGLGGEIQLTTVWVNAASSGDKVQMTYLPRTGGF